jgi:tetratricopeptide (TPR) repeat protein/predicted Ser/Thr protein kinase
MDGDARVGEVVADRFELERAAGRGGMGVVYRARDRQTGERVALKLLTHPGPEAVRRFQREARVLAALRHPAIVRHVDDGVSARGELFIAMEWLEGEPLSARLARAPIGMRDAVALVRRVAEALAVAHADGIVHRDIKPQNLMLRDGKLEGAALLDFGLARLTRGDATMTRAEAVLGTPGYMAPEQAAAQPDVDARADVFALGCLLYELCTGVAPFRAETAVAAMARVLLEDPAPARQHAPSVPEALDALLQRMLAKEPDQRPRDAAHVVDTLRELELPVADEPGARAVASALGEGERRVISVVLAQGAASATDVARELAARHGARFDRLADGSLLATFAGPNAADQAERAAALATAIAAAAPGARVAVATGMSELGRGAALGEVTDRAAGLLVGGTADRVRMDRSTARLAVARVDPAPSEPTALGEVGFVGRAREVALLEAIYDECASEPVARAVLVVAPAGMGKSRLLGELATRLEARADAPELLVGRSAAIGAGSPFAALASLVRRAAGIGAEDDAETALRKLSARVESVIAGAERARVAEFLGELAGVPFAAAPGSALQAARLDPALSGDQMRRAAVDWLAGEAARRPVLLVLDDLHWGDSPTVQLVDAALRTLTRRPFMVLGLARPEVRQTFPSLWKERGLVEVALEPLLPRAAAQLVRARLGADAPAALVDQITASGDGHPFLLDELARHAAAGHARLGGDETAIAVAQAALERTEGDARRVLRAASVFGGPFRKEGVAEIVGGARLVDGWLGELLERQLVRPGAAPSEYVFRHELLREAAYATLTDDDRRLAHGLAGRFLEAAGHTDAVALARHYASGALPARAVYWYRRAAELALEGNDISMVLERVALALDSGAEGEELGRLSLLRAEAHKWRGDNAEAEAHAVEAVQRLGAGTREWFRAVAEAAAAAGKQRHQERLAGLCEALLAVDPGLDLDAARIAWARTAVQLFYVGVIDRMAALIARIEATGGAAAATPQAAGHIYEALAVRGDELARIRFGEQAIAAFEAAGDERNACTQRIVVGFGLNELGSYRRAVAILGAALASAERLGLHNVLAVANLQLGLAWSCSGELDGAEAALGRALAAFEGQGNRLMQAAALTYVAATALARGDLARAERHALAALAAAGEAWMARAGAEAMLARVRLAQGAPLEAVTAARAAVTALARTGERAPRKGLIRLALAEALHGAGQLDEARAALGDARDRIVARAAELDPSLRADFLAQPEHARTLRWAEEWLGT